MANKITFQDFVDSFSAVSGQSKSFSKTFIRDAFQLIREGLVNDGYANIKGLGIFRLQEVADKTIKNPKTGKTTHIKAHNKVVFKPEKALRDKINEPYSDLQIKPLVSGNTLKRKTAAEKVEKDTIFIAPKKEKKESAPAKKQAKTPIKTTITEDNIFISNDKETAPLQKEDDIFVFSDNPDDADILSPKAESKKNKIAADDSETKSMPAFVIKEKKKPSVWRWLIPILMILVLFWFIFYLPQSSNMDFSRLKEKFSFLANDSVLITESVKPRIIPGRDTLSTDHDSMASYTSEDIFVAAPLPTPAKKKKPVQSEAKIIKHPQKPEAVLSAPVKTVLVKSSGNPDCFMPHKSPEERCFVHTVKDGNTLWGLSKKYYERYAYWPNIYRKNIESIRMPDHLMPGTDILIPELMGKAGQLTKTDSAHIAQGYYLAYRAYKKYSPEKANAYLDVAKQFRTSVK